MKTEEQNGLYFTFAEAENFKGIDHRVINIDGRSMIITGKNSANKSSLIQLLLSGIDSKAMPDVVITKGEEKAKATVKIAGHLDGEFVEYTMETFYTAKNGSGRLVLTNTKGEQVKSPKEVLKGIIGNVSFDVFKFLNDTKAKQIEILKQLSGVGKDIDLLDIERKKLYENRTFLGRKVDESEATMNTHGLSNEDIDKYSSPCDTAYIQEELNGISAKITQWNDIESKTDGFKRNVISLSEKMGANILKIEKLKKEIEDLSQENTFIEKEVLDATEKYNKGLEWIKKTPQPSATEVSARLSEALLHNDKHNTIKALVEKQKDLLTQKKELSQMTADIEKIDEKKTKLIKNSKLPISGLTFNSENIFIDGLPMDSKQINTAKLLDVGVEISMALNPTLKYVFLREGSLIDSEGQTNLIKKIHSKGYRLIMECVSDDKELGINFIENEINE